MYENWRSTWCWINIIKNMRLKHITSTGRLIFVLFSTFSSVFRWFGQCLTTANIDPKTEIPVFAFEVTTKLKSSSGVYNAQYKMHFMCTCTRIAHSSSDDDIDKNVQFLLPFLVKPICFLAIFFSSSSFICKFENHIPLYMYTKLISIVHCFCHYCFIQVLFSVEFFRFFLFQQEEKSESVAISLFLFTSFTEIERKIHLNGHTPLNLFMLWAMLNRVVLSMLYSKSLAHLSTIMATLNSIFFFIQFVCIGHHQNKFIYHILFFFNAFNRFGVQSSFFSDKIFLFFIRSPTTYLVPV